MKKKILFGLGLCIICAGLFGCGKTEASGNISEVEEAGVDENETQNDETDELALEENKVVSGMSDKIVKFTAKDQNDNEIKVEDVFSKNTVTMVNVWATFCGPCINEMPELNDLYKELEAENIGLVGIVCDVTDYNGGVDDSQVELAKEIIEETGVTYPNFMLADITALDNVIGIDAVPTTFFVNSSGEIIGEIQIGAVEMDVYKGLALDAKKMVEEY